MRAVDWLNQAIDRVKRADDNCIYCYLETEHSDLLIELIKARDALIKEMEER